LWSKLLTRLAAIVAVVVVAGCRDGSPKYSIPKFEEDIPASFQIMADDIGVEAIYDMYVWKDYVLVIAYDASSSQLLHVYDKRTGGKVTGTLTYGRGPGESILGHMYSTMDAEKGMMYFNDPSRGCRISCDLAALTSGEDIYPCKDDAPLHDAWMNKFFDLRDGHSLIVKGASSPSTDTIDSQRFIIRDIDGHIVSRSNEYPFEEAGNFRDNLYSFAPADMSPDRSKLAMAAMYGAVLETFDVTGAFTVRARATRFFIEPKIGDDINVQPQKSISGFLEICATDDAIFATYDGEHEEGDYGKGSDVFYGNIAVFDWDGNPKEIIRCGREIRNLCMDESEGVIYAVLSNTDGIRSLAKLALHDIAH